MTDLPEIRSLRDGAVRAIRADDLDIKTLLTQETARRWNERTLSLRSPLDTAVPARPGRPQKPDLIPPRQMPKRALTTDKGQIALLHAIAHIELNAVDLALDIVARFATEPVPNSFFDGWMKVAFEEAKHFRMVRDRLRELGADYGDLPAHDGLWQAAHDTRNDLTARLAVVPLILEARGLDVTPALQAKMREAGDGKCCGARRDLRGRKGPCGGWCQMVPVSLRAPEEGPGRRVSGPGPGQFSRSAQGPVQRYRPRRSRPDPVVLPLDDGLGKHLTECPKAQGSRLY
jgi:uncharacterized ferritin-like protein (DUF455 family)